MKIILKLFFNNRNCEKLFSKYSRTDLDGKIRGTKLLNKQLSAMGAKYHEFTRLGSFLACKIF